MFLPIRGTNCFPQYSRCRNKQLGVIAKWCKWFNSKFFTDDSGVDLEEYGLDDSGLANLVYLLSTDDNLNYDANLREECHTFQSAKVLQKLIKSQREKDIVIVSIQSYFQVNLDKYTPLLEMISNSISELQQEDRARIENSKHTLLPNKLNLHNNQNKLKNWIAVSTCRPYWLGKADQAAVKAKFKWSRWKYIQTQPSRY